MLEVKNKKISFVFDVSFICRYTEILNVSSEKKFFGIASFKNATSDEVTSLDRLDLLNDGAQCHAGACFVRSEHKNFLPSHTIPLICQKPWENCVRLMKALDAHVVLKKSSGIHDSAWVHPSAQIPKSCYIGPFTVIEEDVVLGEECVLGAHVVVGKGVVIGRECRIDAHVTLFHAELGHRVHIHSGARIGQSGFGFLMTDSGPVDIPHWGKVRIGSDVVLGANTTIDRGTLDDTVIGDRVRIDNTVQIAHNVQLGNDVVLAAQTGISGSCVIEDKCMLGGQVGLAPGVRLGSGTVVAAKSGVMRSTLSGTKIAGIPAIPLQQWKRQIIYLQKLFSNNKG
ncbi:UDP-3-O-acylglucosamine N-acyltransferase [Holospora obtusa F1]|uniref:UDP-3-O-acylglucosamine N-acyltransferase n=1 Tax=Holospora obtusa F1 TaxID=1399147 RepID=W6TEG3_HOLOB|nr:UDP-3-O-(3-hydroxymyristoyl)glucosamine N-acyltransferase [Holospora obtusa]ETZ07633.1 UDP-3-O-acylglucosamine N-acyltransferase [Holospora obtusa F1]